MQSLRRHRPQCPVMLCHVPLLASVTLPNLPRKGCSCAKNITKPGRKSAVGAGRSPLRFWLLLPYSKSNSPRAKCEKGIGEIRFFASLRMIENAKRGRDAEEGQVKHERLAGAQSAPLQKRMKKRGGGGKKDEAKKQKRLKHNGLRRRFGRNVTLLAGAEGIEFSKLHYAEDSTILRRPPEPPNCSRFIMFYALFAPPLLWVKG